MRGDNCAQPDGVVSRAALAARVIRVERGGREARCGIQIGAAAVAALSRRGWLLSFATAVRAPRSAAARALRVAQGRRLYRRVARRAGRGVTVRPASEADMAVVRRRLAAGIGGGPADDRSARRWVARRHDRVVGFVEFADRRQSEGAWTGCWLFSLEVWPLWRGAGLGERLTRAVLTEGRARGVGELRLAVYEDNERAVRLYRKLGFRRVSVPELEPQLVSEYAQAGRRRVVMAVDLSARPADGAGPAGHA